MGEQEKNKPVAICDRFETLKYFSSLVFAFIEQGKWIQSADVVICNLFHFGTTQTST